MAKQKVVVLFGGASKENRVSLRSAYDVLSALSTELYEIIPIGITKAGRWLYFPGDYEKIQDGTWEEDSDCCSAIISPDALHRGILKLMDDGDINHQRIDVMFSVVHGKYGECGRIQALCKMAGIPFVGCADDVSNFCTDKMLTHLLLDKAGINTPCYHYLERVKIKNIEESAEEIEKLITYPMYVRPASCSTAIGSYLVNNRDELTAAAKNCFSHHHKVLAEEYVEGRELTVAAYGSSYSVSVSAVGEIVKTGGVDNEYVEGSSGVVIPAALDKAIKAEIDINTKYAFQALGCNGFALFTYKLRGNTLYCTKVSNVPGFARINVFPRLMEASGYDYPDMLEMLINMAIDERS